MRRMIVRTAIALCLLLTFHSTGSAIDIDIGGIDIGIGGPPRLEFAGPPELVPIPGRYVYFVPDIDSDLFFYHDRWYRPYNGRWFRSDNYAGPWERVREVPPALTDLPPDYRNIPPGYSTIPYGELRNNWEMWEREKYWDRREEGRIREHEREEREREERAGPPRLEIAGPLELVPIPDTYVYFEPDIDSDLFYFHGRWYRPYKGRWFRSDHYVGPWERIHEVPPALTDLPPDYRSTSPGDYRIPYGELRNNWERWEQERYWDRREEDRGIREERDRRPERERDRY